MDITSIINYYEKELMVHGDSHLGVAWPDKITAQRRYQVVLDPIKPAETVLDFGCGLAALYQYAKDYNIDIKYSGLDISDKFITIAKSKFPEIQFVVHDILKTPLATTYDHIIMNGVLTVKRDLSYNEMLEYTEQLIKTIARHANKTIIVNFMSKFVDWERDDLFHMPFNVLIKIVMTITRKFTIRHDYNPYEYTIYIYK